MLGGEEMGREMSSYEWSLNKEVNMFQVHCMKFSKD